MKSLEIRGSGSAALDMLMSPAAVWMASSIDLQPWDYAAGSIILSEACGRITTADNPPSCPCDSLLASNTLLHYILGELLK
jgi:myo-inositol-1(or 4)-monophosphatase